MKLNIRGYRELLRNVWYWKYHIHIGYRNVEFKFRNTGLGNNGASKLTISGIVPSLETVIPSETVQFSNIQTQQISSTTIPEQRFGVGSKEYVIYTELRGINLERWNVSIPFVYPQAGWNCIANIRGIPDSYKLIAGLGYKQEDSETSSNIGDILIFDEVVNWSGKFGLQFSTDTTKIITPANVSEQLTSFVTSKFNDYGEHPLIILYTDTGTANLNSKKFYNVLPIGIEKYKVKLELANGESVTRFFDWGWNPITVPPQSSTNVYNVSTPESRD